MSSYFHIIKDFSQASISPNYLGETKMDYINAMAFHFLFSKTQKINSVRVLCDKTYFS